VLDLARRNGGARLFEPEGLRLHAAMLRERTVRPVSLFG
jgi:hypothetical protein